MVCLDANIVIYLVEQNPFWEPKVAARIAAYRVAGEEIAVSDAARLECLVGPFQTGNADDLGSYAAFFAGPSPRMLPITVAVWDQVADSGRIRIQAARRPSFGRRGRAWLRRFLSNDAQLKSFPDVLVEILS